MLMLDKQGGSDGLYSAFSVHNDFLFHQMEEIQGGGIKIVCLFLTPHLASSLGFWPKQQTAFLKKIKA